MHDLHGLALDLHRLASGLARGNRQGSARASARGQARGLLQRSHSMGQGAGSKRGLVPGIVVDHLGASAYCWESLKGRGGGYRFRGTARAPGGRWRRHMTRTRRRTPEDPARTRRRGELRPKERSLGIRSQLLPRRDQMSPNCTTRRLSVPGSNSLPGPTRPAMVGECPAYIHTRAAAVGGSRGAQRARMGGSSR